MTQAAKWKSCLICFISFICEKTHKVCFKNLWNWLCNWNLMIFNYIWPFGPSPGPQGVGQKKECRWTPHSCEQLTHQIWLDFSNGLGDRVTDRQTDRQTEKRMDGSDCNIPIPFWNKRGDNYTWLWGFCVSFWVMSTTQAQLLWPGYYYHAHVTCNCFNCFNKGADQWVLQSWLCVMNPAHFWDLIFVLSPFYILICMYLEMISR